MNVMFKGIQVVMALALLTAPLYAAEKPVVITPASIVNGFYYKSSVVADGVIQLSECAPMSGKNGASYRNYTCSAEGAGYRCTGKGLDVVFVFKNLSTCRNDRSRTLDAGEEG